MKKGDEIFYCGDMANNAGFGKITAIEKNQWATLIFIKMEDGRNITVYPSYFSEEYSGNGSTPFVLKSAYLKWKEAGLKRLGIGIQI